MKTFDPVLYPKFRNKDGSLTAYSFACGYIETEDFGKINLQLWHEGACYHVRAHDHDEKGRLFWESFDTLGEARKFFKQKIREFKKGIACSND